MNDVFVGLRKRVRNYFGVEFDVFFCEVAMRDAGSNAAARKFILWGR